MPTMESNLKHEEEAAPDKVRLAAAGEFLRAYNRSAWRFYSCISKYKVIKKFLKAQQKEIYFLGFPSSKLLELVNGRRVDKTDFGFDITLKPEEIPAQEEYEKWTKEVPVEAASRADVAALPPTGRDLESAVCRKIRAFALETKSPLEALVFLSEMRKALAGEESGETL